MKVFSVLLAFLTLSEARLRPKGRIVGGYVASNESVPFIVSLQLKGDHFCGGSIINERTILTAAHCFASEEPMDITAFVGATTRSSKEGKRVPVKAIHRHKNFSEQTVDNDIALVRLSHDLSPSTNISPIRLADPGDDPIDGTHGLACGWGMTDETNPTIPDTLRCASVPIVDRSTCNDFYESSSRITEHMFCAGYFQGGIDTCRMDSGGPFVVGNRLFGIVSWGDGCAKPQKPGVYASVKALRSWVERTLIDVYNEEL